MDAQYVWSVIIFAGIVTYLPRALPLLLLANAPLPAWFARWLKYVPAAVFGALIFSEIFVRESGLNLTPNNIYLLSSIGVLLVAVKTRSLALSIAVGLLFFYLLQNQVLVTVSF
jgi:branched-subunit amino acid transport protein